jgi:hypothetical protein
MLLFLLFLCKHRKSDAKTWDVFPQRQSSLLFLLFSSRLHLHSNTDANICSEPHFSTSRYPDELVYNQTGNSNYDSITFARTRSALTYRHLSKTLGPN